jgi:hypothetical protein
MLGCQLLGLWGSDWIVSVLTSSMDSFLYCWIYNLMVLLGGDGNQEVGYKGAGHWGRALEGYIWSLVPPCPSLLPCQHEVNNFALSCVPHHDALAFQGPETPESRDHRLKPQKL